MMVVTRDNANRYRVSQICGSTAISPPGASTGPSRPNKPLTPNRRASCARAIAGRGFVLVGRWSNDQLYSSAGVILPPANFVSQTPIAETSWEAIGNTTNVQGGGAMASNNTKIALAFNTTDNRLYIRTRNLPYSQNTFRKNHRPATAAGARG